MKRATPYDKITLEQVVKSKQETLKNLRDTCDSYKLFLLPEKCKGLEIPKIIKMITGRDISHKSLYRWGVKLNHNYSTTKIYSKDDVLKYLSLIFLKPKARKKDKLSETPKAL